MSNKYFFTVVFVLIFLPLVITFVWLNSFIAKEIWYRRRPVTVKDYRSTTFSEDASNDKPTCETQASTPHDDNKKCKLLLHSYQAVCHTYNNTIAPFFFQPQNQFSSIYLKIPPLRVITKRHQRQPPTLIRQHWMQKFHRKRGLSIKSLMRNHVKKRKQVERFVNCVCLQPSYCWWLYF